MPADITKSLQHIVYGLAKTPVSVAVDPPSQAGAGIFSVDVAVAAANRGDIVFAIPPAALEATLKPVGAVANSAGNVRLTLQATGVIDGASLTWQFIVLDRT